MQEQCLRGEVGKARPRRRARRGAGRGGVRDEAEGAGARPAPRERGRPPSAGWSPGRTLDPRVRRTRGAGRPGPASSARLARPHGAARPGSVRTAARGAWSPQRGASLAPGGFRPQGQPHSLPQQPPHKEVVHGLVIPSHPCFFTICHRGRKSLVPGPICGGQGREQEAGGFGPPAHLPSACRSPRRRRRGQGGRAWGWPGPGLQRVQDPPPGLLLLPSPDHTAVEKLRPGHARAGPAVSPRHPGSPPTGPARTPSPRRQPGCGS